MESTRYVSMQGRVIYLTLVLIVLLFVGPKGTRADVTLLTPLVGKWQVTGVRLDETLTRTPTYDYNDPRLMGRVITISENEIAADMPETTICSEPRATLKTSTMDALLRESMGKHKKGAPVTARDFSLNVKRSDALQVLWIGCKKGDIGPDTPYGPEGENWIAKVSQDHLTMRWYDNTILLLKRVSSSTSRRPR